MKKSVFVAAAALLLASGLTAGVVASYSTTLDSDDATITAKQFTFLRADSGDTVIDVKLAPGDDVTYTVEVKNFEDTYISEVDIAVSFEVELVGDLAPALEMVVTNDTFQLAKNVADTKSVSIAISWPYGLPGEDNQYIDKTAQISVVATGTQVNGNNHY